MRTHRDRLPTHPALLGLGFIAFSLAVFAASCPNETASTKDHLKACCNCESMQDVGEGGTCTYHETDVTGYCDCKRDYKCEKTGTTYPNHQVTTYTGGQCPGRFGCTQGCSGGSSSTSLGTVTEYQGQPCGY